MQTIIGRQLYLKRHVQTSVCIHVQMIIGKDKKVRQLQNEDLHNRIDMYLIVQARTETRVWTGLLMRVSRNISTDIFQEKKRRERKSKD